MATAPIPLRLPKHLLEVAKLRARLERVDRASALRQLLHRGATDYVLEQLEAGRISLSKAAQLLDCSTLEVYRRAQERGLRIGGDLEDQRLAGDTLPRS